jgi:hypothetical protein
MSAGLNNPEVLPGIAFMPAPAMADGPGTTGDEPPCDPFEALDEDFETVLGALLRGGLDPDEAQEVGRQTLLSLWRCSADQGRLRGPALAELATRVAGALCPQGITREYSSGERSPRPGDAPAG